MDPLLVQSLLVNRREFFGRSACGIGSAALASLLAKDGLGADSKAARIGGLDGVPHFAPKAKRVIYLFQNGAPTHCDLFDYKPKLKELHGKPVPEAAVAGKRFSTMTGAPRMGPAFSANSRAMTSTPPPAANGTITLMALSGNALCCAKAGAAQSATSVDAAIRR